MSIAASVHAHDVEEARSSLARRPVSIALGTRVFASSAPLGLEHTHTEGWRACWTAPCTHARAHARRSVSSLAQVPPHLICLGDVSVSWVARTWSPTATPAASSTWIATGVCDPHQCGPSLLYAAPLGTPDRGQYSPLPWAASI